MPFRNVPSFAKIGETGNFVHKIDWSTTNVGVPEQWPLSLKTLTAMIMGTRFPMIMFWGDQSTAIYNDAFRPLLGDESPLHTFGKNGLSRWKRIWPGIEEIVRSILNTGEAILLEDELMSDAGSEVENVYWTFSFSAVVNDNGRISGVLMTGSETTRAVENMQQLKLANADLQLSIAQNVALQRAHRERDNQLRNVADSSPTGLWLSNRHGSVTYLNKTLIEWTGLPLEELIGAGWTNTIIPEDRQRAINTFVGAVERRAHYDTQFRIRKYDGSVIWCHAAGDPYFNDEKVYEGYAGFCMDINDSVRSQQDIRESQEELLRLFEQSPVAIAVIDRVDLTFRLANDFYCNLVGRLSNEILHKPLLEALPELKGQGFDKLLNAVIETGRPYISNEVAAKIGRDDSISTIYVDLAYQPMRKSNGDITGVLVVATDVTAQVQSRKEIEQSEIRFHNLMREVNVGLVVLSGDELVVTMVNEAYARIVKRTVDELMHLPIFETLPDAESTFRSIIDQVRTSGTPVYLNKVPYHVMEADGTRFEGFLDLVYQPYREQDGTTTGVIVIVNEVTEQALSAQRLIANEAKFRSLIEEAPFATALYVGENLVIDIANEAMIKVWGKSAEVVGQPLAEALPELEGQPFIPLLQSILATGETYRTREQSANLMVEGKLQTFWFNFTYKPLFDERGEVYGILNMAVDITPDIIARRQVEKAESILSAAIELAELATWNIDLLSGKITYSNRLRQWLGLEGDVVFSDLSPQIHEKDRDRVRDAIQRATLPGGDGKLDEIYTIVNDKSGRQRIIHTVGKTFFDLGGRPLTLTGTAQDITRQKELQLTLEDEVQRRTEELAAAIQKLKMTNDELAETNNQLMRSNEELAQYAYVASHDLQEPLRKIHIFSDMLSGEGLPAKEKNAIEKIQSSAKRMSLLIKDLLEFSRLLNSDSMMTKVDLAKVVQSVISDFELVILEKNAIVDIGPLPVIEGIRMQLNQLFFNLVSNALKFARVDEPLRINITSSIATPELISEYIEKPISGITYYLICIEDNGIGFDVKFLQQIFELFRRLHRKDEYSGSGIGLAVCRRAVLNHRGGIYAESTPGSGSRFFVILPEQQNY